VEESQEPKDIQSQIDKDHKVENKLSVLPVALEEKV
jgi:hypothetical protein